MKLEEFQVGGGDLALRDLSVLRGMPLRKLALPNAPGATDLHFLENCQSLEDIVLPPHAVDIEFLRKLPNLRRISRQGKLYGRDATMTAEEFWKAEDAARASQRGSR